MKRIQNLTVFIFCILFIFSCSETDKKNKPVTTADELYRPAYHFKPDSNWINDANGLLFANGQYHLFYQYNPYGKKWGHMSWGHSTSTDLLHWKTLPVALYEEKDTNDADTTMIFSGSAVLDKNNSAGFGKDGTASIVAVYTSFRHSNLQPVAQHQSLAYSNDNGVTWTKFAGNPVLDMHSTEFRDPKVMWYQPQQKWVMVVSKPDAHEYLFYSSKNLKEWSFMSKWGKQGDTARVWECPDLIELQVEGTAEKKWILLSSAGHPQNGYAGMQYFVGDFDGNQFTPVHAYTKPVYLDYGKDYYAAASYNDAPNGRHILVGWNNNWEYANDIPTGNLWRGSYSIPRELKLIKSTGDYQLLQQPVAELNTLRKEAFSLKQNTLEGARNLDYHGNSYQMEVTMEPGTAKTSGIKILMGNNEETVLKYERDSGVFVVDRTKSGAISFNKKFPSVEKAPVQLKDGKIKLLLLVDKSVVELFINDGEAVITDLVFPTDTKGGIQLFSEGGKTLFSDITVWDMKPVK